MKQTKEYFREYRKKNPEKMKQIHARYRKKNLEKVKIRQNEWARNKYSMNKIK